ncbi:hypothetical protein Ahy_B07g087055 [Arachis hypogaea]|uniref:Uncharacterized protein n=1 Tax=Arachis hypogaea TaxID=3818 RepID=A0A444YB83_ARAHY|nr:hypothetical protein Ahy_B07g087055 [Arachis hypogaea]
MGFGALGHIPELNVSHTLLRELIRCFDVYQECLDTLYGKIYKTLAKIRDALGINFGRDHFPKRKEIVDSFKGATLASLTKYVIDMSVEGEENLLKFKRTFVVFIQKCFSLPTTVSTISSVHKPPVLHVEIV